MTLTVYHLRISQSERAVWVCEELGIDYELFCFDRDPTTRLAPEEYKKLSPTQTAPVITDVKTSGKEVIISESGAVVEYIDSVYGNSKLALPKDDDDYAAYLFWFHFANASLMATVLTDMCFQIVDVSGHPFVDSIKGRLTTYYELLDKQFAKNTWISGENFTLADILIVFPLTTMNSFVKTDFSAYPNIQAYVRRISARPAYQRAMLKGDNLKVSEKITN